MKVAHFSFGDTIGAYGAAYELHTCMRKRGIDSTFFVRNKTREDNSVVELEYSDSRQERLLRTINLLYFRYNQIFDTTGCSLDEIGIVWTKEWEEQLEKYDVYHLHWVTGLLSLDNILHLLRMGKRIVWSVHDFHPFTSICHYPFTCIGYKNGCVDCAQLKVKQNMMVQLEWLRKKLIYEKDICIIAASDWMKQRVYESKLFGENYCEKIPIGINENIFKIKDKKNTKYQFGFKEDEKVILIGAQNVLSKAKGYAIINTILRTIVSDEFCQSLMKLKKLKVVSFGRGAEQLFLDCIPMIDLGFIEDREVLCSLYNACDVFLFPSVQESFGMTAVESMFCGTPVVAYDTCAMKEVICNNVNGWSVGVEETYEMAQKVIYFLQNDKFDRNACREYVLKNYTLDGETQKIIKLYEKLRSSKNYIERLSEIEITNEKMEKLVQNYYSEIIQESAINQSKNSTIPMIFDKYNPMFMSITKKIDKLIQDRKINCQIPIFIFGAGNLGMQTLKSLKDKKMNVVGFWDNAEEKCGGEIEGYYITKPQLFEEKRNRCILISTYEYTAIKEQLIQLGYIADKNFF